MMKLSGMRFVFGAAFLLLAACSQQQDATPSAARSAMHAPAAQDALSKNQATAEMAAESSAAAAAQTHPQSVQPGQFQSSVGTAAGSGRQFVITASVRAQVADVYQAALAIEEAALAQGGFVVSNAITSERAGPRVVAGMAQQQRKVTEVYERRANLRVRVPAAQTQAFLRDIAKHLQFLHQRQIDARDVQLDLLRERLNAEHNRLLQQNLQEIANSANRDKTSEKLDAAHARYHARHAQEAAQLAQKELQDQVDFSTIDLELHQGQIVHTSVEPDINAIVSTSRLGLARQVGAALAAGAEMATATLVGLLHAWPLFVLIAAALVVMQLWKKRTARSTKSAPPAEQESVQNEQ